MSKQLDKNIQRLGSIFPEIQRFFHNISVEVSKTGDFTIAQYRVLSLLSQFGKMTVNDLKNHLHIAQSSASGIVDRLEQTGLLKRTVSNIDKRVTELELTYKAKNILAKKADSMENVYRKILESLNEKDQSDFIRSFENLLKHINKIEKKHKND
jgi:DNA-binding MarR family transcriptional regulator